MLKERGGDEERRSKRDLTGESLIPISRNRKTFSDYTHCFCVYIPKPIGILLMGSKSSAFYLMVQLCQSRANISM